MKKRKINSVQIRVSFEVLDAIRKQARGFDNMDSVLRRVFKLPQKKVSSWRLVKDEKLKNRNGRSRAVKSAA